MTNAYPRRLTVRRVQEFIYVLTLLAFSSLAYSQNEQYSQGLLMDLHVIESEDDANAPKGRSMATMVDPTPSTIGYLEPIEIEPALEQFRDKYWGLHSHGVIKIEDAGPHSFNLMMTSDENISCASWLNIQDRAIAAHELDWRNKGHNNQYGEVSLRPGIYQFKVWLGCSDMNRGGAESLTLTINMRGPNDAMLKPIPKNQLLHEL